MGIFVFWTERDAWLEKVWAPVYQGLVNLLINSFVNTRASLMQMRNAVWRRSETLGNTNATNHRRCQLHFTLFDICYHMPAVMLRVSVGGL